MRLLTLSKSFFLIHLFFSASLISHASFSQKCSRVLSRSLRLFKKDMVVLRESKKSKPDEKKELLATYSKPAPKGLMLKSIALTNYALSSLALTKILAGFSEAPEQVLGAMVLVPVGIFLSDLSTQLVHKFLDCYGSEGNPIWGSTVREFRHHHEVPSNLDSESYLDTIRS